ncbi:MAG: hypothetical protein AAB316_22315 [Bacteroidota bacterium]
MQSPWFGVPEPAGKLLECLTKNPLSKTLKIPKEGLHRTLFPGEPQTDFTSLNKAMNSLLSAVKKFLVQREMEQDEPLIQRLLMRAGKRHHSHWLFEESAASLLDSLEQAPPGILGLHENELLEFQALSDIYFHPSTEKFKKDVEALQKTIAAFERYSIAGKLFFTCEVYNRRQFIADRNLLADIEDVIQSAWLNHASQNVTIHLYLKVLDLLRHGRNDHQFQTTCLLFFKHAGQIGPIERRALLVFLVNHANHVYKSGVDFYMSDILSLYQFGLKQDMLTSDGEMPPGTFINIANAAALCKRFRIAKSFIQEYTGSLHPDEREGAISIASAFLCFQQGKFSDASSLANNADLSSLRYALIAKPLMLKSAYEELAISKTSGNTTHLSSQIDAFRQYLKRDKNIHADRKESYKKFINLTRQTTSALVKGYINSTVKMRLLKAVHSENPPFAQDWLEAKILAIPVKAGKR